MKDNKIKFRQQKGTSLIEVMISLVILGFFMLGNSPLMLSTIESNRQAQRVTAATHLALDKFEDIRGLNYVDVVDGTDGPLSGSGELDIADDDIDVIGAIYTRKWVVLDDTPLPNSKTISVTTSWEDKDGTQDIQIKSIISL